MRRIIFGKVLLCMMCAMGLFISDSKLVYAMEPLQEQIAEKQEFVNAKNYEMNLVLDGLGIKRWNAKIWGEQYDEGDGKHIDQPLGVYSLEKLEDYIEEGFSVEIEYGCGFFGALKEPELIQIVKIYKEKTFYGLYYVIWCEVSNGGVIHDERHFYTNRDDIEKRRMESGFYED